MDAKEFVKQAKRMCEYYGGGWGTHNRQCIDCPACDFNCKIYPSDDTSIKFIDVVEKWSKEHPIMTNLMKFKEVFGRDVICFEKGLRPMGVMPEPKYLMDWLDAEYVEPPEGLNDAKKDS